MSFVKGKVMAPLLGSAILHAALIFVSDLGKRDTNARISPILISSHTSEIVVTLKPQTLEERTEDHVLPVNGFSSDASIAQKQEQPPMPYIDHPQQNHEGTGWLSTLATTYYSSEQLTKRPQPAEAINFDSHRIQNIIATGKMLFQIWINEEGIVEDVELEKADLPPPFDEEALTAIRGARFVPGELHGRPVKSKLKIEVNYDDGRAPAKNN